MATHKAQIGIHRTNQKEAPLNNIETDMKKKHPNTFNSEFTEKPQSTATPEKCANSSNKKQKTNRKEGSKKNIEFSIIMPAYNAERTISEAIESALKQTFENFELLIVNDNSKDKTKNIIENYANSDPRIKILNLNKNRGVAHARNIAIKIAAGKYIAFLDSDDIWLEEKLNTQRKFLEDGYDLVYSSYTMFWENGKEKQIIPPQHATQEELLKGNFIGNLTGVYNCQKIGKFYQKEIGAEDYLMWIEIIRKAERNAGIPKPLAKYRVSNASISANKLKSAAWNWSIYRTHLKFGALRSCYYFSHYIYNSISKRL